MASLIFKENGIKTVIVKAKNRVHRRILEKMEVDKIISPEEEMGIKLAKGIMNRSLIEMIDLSEDYSIVELWIGKTLISLNLRTEYGMNVLCIKNPNKELDISPSLDYKLERGDILVAIVENKKIEDTELA
mgnify:CR=1 FL=1